MSHHPGGLRRPRTFLAVLQAVALILTLGWVAGGPAMADSHPTDVVDGVSGVTARDDVIEVSGHAPAGAEVEVYALGTEADPASWPELEPVATVTADDAGTFGASLPWDAESGLYYAKYLAVSDGQVLGTFRYVDDNQVTPLQDFAYPEALSKKGLQVQMTDDAEVIGNQHAGINMPLDQLMQLEDEGPENTITFVSQGREFYFDRQAVEASDRQIKPLSDNDQIVNLILLVYASDDPNSAAQVLIHPDADFSGGPVFGFNTETAEGVAHYTAAMEFITQRYTMADERYGRAVGFIVSNEVDAQWTWSNMGDKPLEEFLMYYERAMRITHMAAQAAYGGARTYTSLTHCWTIVCGANPDPENPTRYYPVRDVVDGLNALTKAHGDYGWYLAHHPYPENLFDPAFWEDTTATDDVETTPRITFKNIELLPAYLARPELLFEGESRRVILSEQGCNTANNSEEAQLLQAACYALAYYKVRFLDSIDNFILHRHVDHKIEGGLRLGLWTWDEDRPEPSSPDERKIIHEVFQYIDTERSLEVTESLLDVIGIDDWSELVPGWDPTALAQRPLPTAVGASTTARPKGETTTVADFADGTDGWRISDNVTSVTAADGDLVVGFDSLASLWRGTDVELTTPLDATDQPVLTTQLQVPADAAIGTRYARIKVYSGSGGVIAEGTARLADGGGTQRVSIDLTGWDGLEEITRIKIWVSGSTNADWAGELRVGDIHLAERLAGTGRTTNIQVSAAAPQGSDVGAPLELTVTNNDLRPAEADLVVQPCLGIGADPDAVELDGLGTGQTRTYTLAIETWEPADPQAPTVCLQIQGERFQVPVSVPPPTAESVYDFDDGTTQGWQAGQNVMSVRAATSFLNGPGGPQDGSHVLAAEAEVGPATDLKSVVVEPDVPLDLSDAVEVVVFLDSYGGAPGATGYEATFTLTSGEDELTVTQPYSPDSWNELVLDVSGWEGRASIDRIEVGMRAVGTDFATWNPQFQIDSVGYYDRPRS
ncbi:DUF5722 domain-containing protein [Pseudactinotalea terrae]|uniref:DUF5722 domain-containing protein n=1 Tax=Pseudactinotalea terrae TaxID=1743262 RepID=UPI0012E105C0|nr:DUF5722 domain-containing protein [Pseudactinotalea terrae]